MSDKLEIFTANWKTYQSDLRKIREAVFINEQSVPEELEWDEDDSSAIHFLVRSDNVYIATGRLKPDGQIGRMAVIKPFRRRGIGSELLDYILLKSKECGFKKVFLHAQVNVADFYRNKNFVASGDIFEEANIPHQTMFKVLD